MKERAITPAAQVMLRGLSAPDWLVGLLVGSIPAGIGLILGPVISVKSDRYRSRWGRRIPFLLLPTPVIVLAMVGMALAPSLGSWVHRVLSVEDISEVTCQIGIFALFWTVLEISTIIVNTLFGALVKDVVPEALVGRFFGLFRVVALLAGVLFNYFLMGIVSTHTFEIFLSLGLLYGIGFTLMCLNVKEGHYPKAEALVPEKDHRLGASIVVYVKECYTHSFYLWFYLATTLGALALGPVNTFSIFHARSVGMSDDLYGKALALSYTGSLFLAYPLGSLADRFHPLRLGISGMGLYAFVTALGFVFATSIWTFFAAFVLHTVVAGTYMTGIASITQRLLPSTKFAQFSSAAGILGALCYMVLPPPLGVLIEYMGRDYRYVFLVGCILALGSLSCYLVVFRKFQALGGDRSFVPPEVKE